MYRLELGTSVKLVFKGQVNPDYYQELKEIKRLGFESVEVSMGSVGGYKFNMEKATEVAADALQAVLDEGLILNSVHMPFQRFIYISSCDEGVRAWASDEFRKLIEVCNPFKPRNYVFHSKVGRAEEGLVEARKPALFKTFREMIAATDSNVCIENMTSTSYPNTIDAMKEVLQEVENSKCCIDMNHFMYNKPEDAIIALGKWLRNIHVSDYDGTMEKHWMPKTGAIDWMKVIGALEQVGYQGAFTYEVLADPNKRPYSFAEIRENYDQLFEEYNKLRSH